MATIMFVLLVFGIFLISYTISKNNVHYTYRFIEVNAVNPDEFVNKRSENKINKHEMVKNLQRNFQFSKSEPQRPVPRAIQNLFTTLDGFQNELCLLIIDNWQNVDIQQTAAMPSMIRNLEIVLSHRKVRRDGQESEYLDQVLIPANPSFFNKNFSEYHLKDSKYHNCPISSFYYPLTANKGNDNFCVDIAHEMFLLKSRPWQCKIQVNLLMQEHFL